MKALSVTLLMALAIPSSSFAEDTSPEVIRLNNEGVAAQDHMVIGGDKNHAGHYAKNLIDSDWKAPIDKFQEALKIDPGYGLARDNLSIAQSNFGLWLAHRKNRVPDAIKQFHHALSSVESNPTIEYKKDIVERNMEKDIGDCLHIIGKDPKSFVVRAHLGDEAKASNDLGGAAFEYRAALKLKNDRPTHKKLGDIYRLLGEKDKAVAEFAAAYRD